jgi:hypothetical protein
MEGWRFSFPEGEVREYFGRWGSQIGELQPASLTALSGWLGWFGVILPLVLIWGAWAHKDRVFLASGVLLVILFALSFSAARWGYFAALAGAILLPSGLALIRPRWLVWPLLLVSLWPLAGVWDKQIFPDSEASRARAEARRENILLRETAMALRGIPPGDPVLAPWWTSPALAYWSGHPFVAGSSHQSLPGTVASARFYLSETDDEALSILSERNVAFVVSDDPSRIVQNSISLLGMEAPLLEMATRLQRLPPPDFLNPVFRNPFFGIFEVKPKKTHQPEPP